MVEENSNNSDSKSKAPANNQGDLPLIFSEEKEPLKKESEKTEKQPVDSDKTKQPESKKPNSSDSGKTEDNEEIIAFRIVDEDKTENNNKPEAQSKPKKAVTLTLSPTEKKEDTEKKEISQEKTKDSKPVKAAVKLEKKVENPVTKTDSKTVKLEKPKSEEKAVKPEPVKLEKPKSEEKAVKPVKLENKPEVKPAPDKKELPKQSVQIVGKIKTENVTVGQILQDARVRYELSLNQVEQVTKIKKSFVEALERDDISTLPPLVYVNAYIKTLCDLYEISQEDTAQLIRQIKMKNPASPVSEEIIHHLEEEKQVNYGEEVKVKRYFIIIVTLIVLGIISVVVGSYIFFKKDAKKNSTDIKPPPVITTEKKEPVEPDVKAVSYEKIETLIAPEITNMNELDIPDSN